MPVTLVGTMGSRGV